MEAVLQLVQRINFYLSDYILVFLLIGTGLYFSVRTRFVQVRCFGEGMRAVFGEFNMRGGRQKGGLSSFQALTTAIAAQVGTGNIIGACGAILLGGPGAIFWMWIIAFFGMATIYAEADDYDDSELWQNVNDLKSRIEALETKIGQMNTEIAALQKIVDDAVTVVKVEKSA